MVKARSGVVVEAQGLGVGYGQSTVWQDADFEIKKGQFTAVLGPNGAGKTTLLKLLLGLNKPSAGELLVLGRQPRRGNPSIGYVAQHHNVDSDIRVEAVELVKLGLSGHRWGVGLSDSASDYAKAFKALVDVGARDLAHRSLGVLSGGELQRVFIAQALVSNPRLLLLDEPLANLDIRRQTELVQLINSIIRSRKVTVILIAHDINPLLGALDSVVYIANGKVATGTPEEVINSKTLSELYEVPIEVLRGSNGRLAVLGIEEAVHAHD